MRRRFVICVITATVVGSLTPAPTGAAIRRSRLVFGLTSGKHQGLYMVGTDGSKPTQIVSIVPGLNDSFDPDWAPDGTHIAFTAGRTSDGTFTVKPSGRGLKRLSQSDCYAEFDPDWSPDSDQIVFRHDTCERAYIWTMDRDGTNRHRISPGRGFSPQWSPTGELIAYSKRVKLRQDQVAVMRPDGTNEVVLTSSPGSQPTHSSIEGNSFPRFSPDGELIVYEGRIATDGDRSDEVCVIRTDGSESRCLTDAPGDDDQGEFAPSGDSVVFVGSRDGDLEIFTVGTDGTGERQLTHNQRGDFSPSWSPDGRWIAFLSRRTGFVDLYVMHPDGTHVRRLTHSRGQETEPAWSA